MSADAEPKKVTFEMSDLDYYELSENQEGPARTRRPSIADPTGCREFFRQCDPRKDPTEFLNTLALGFLVCGLILVTVAFMIPRDYKFDATLPAAEMEAIEMKYTLLAKRLDICIAVGTVLVAIGAVIIGGIFMVMLVRGDFLQCFEGQRDEEDNYGCNNDEQGIYKDQKDYGTDQRESAATSTQTDSEHLKEH